jgi:hypothetical protein
MLKRPFRSALFLTVVCNLAACGSTPAAKAPAPASSAQPVPPAPVAVAPAPAAAAEPAPPQPQESPGFAQALAALRPAGTEPVLQALAGAPGDAEAYAKAALAFAPTDVPGMALLWGLSYQAMGGGASDAAVASALSKVLTERILAKPDAQQQVTFNLRLAPGAMPTRVEADGATLAPIAHTFESLFSPAVTGFRPPWTIEQFYDALSSWAGIVATRGTPLDEKLPVNAWLALAAKQGHLEAFCYQLLGPAFPAELKAFKGSDPAALQGYREFLKTSPLRPQHAALPDELVRIK